MAGAESLLTIPAFYEDKNVFITGASGFMGQLLLEKLLRSCPGIKKIYLLIREKKGQTARERTKCMFSEVIFEKLLEVNPEVEDKVVPVAGDVAEPGLGLSEEDAEMIIENTNIVIHTAATVRFNEPLKMAVKVNLIGTRTMLQFSRKMKHLVSFVHVSTAYANCPRSETEEIFYPPPCNAQRIIDLVEWMDEEALDTITPTLLKEWPNTYTFTKALAESIILEESQGLPIIVVRPSIVTSTWREPFPGWTTNLNGPIGIIIGGGKGIIRTMQGDSVLANCIPADIANNLIIAASWYIAVYRPKDILIFHGTAENNKTMTWTDMLSTLYPLVLQYPSERVYRYPGGSMKKSKLHNKLTQFTDHIIPAAFLDCLCYLKGKNPKFLKLYEKVHTATDCIAYFANNEWNFHKENVYMLENALNPEDKETFNFNIDELHLSSYWENCIIGARKYILKESYCTLPLARKRLTRIYVIQKVINGALIIGGINLLYSQSETAQFLWNSTIDSISSLIFN